MAPKDPFAGIEFEEPVAVVATSGRKAAMDPVEKRRGKLTDAIQKQIDIQRNPDMTWPKKVAGGETKEHQPRSWIKRTADKDIFVVEPKYGPSSFEYKKGQTKAFLKQPAIIPFFNALLQAAEEGTYDDKLTKLAEARKRK